MRPVIVRLMGLPLVPMTVSWPADTKLFVRGTTATSKRHSGSLLLSTGRLEVPLPGLTLMPMSANPIRR